MNERRYFTTRITPLQVIVLSVISWLALTLTVYRTPQSLYSDPSYQMDALQEYFDRDSRSFNRRVSPDERDLTQDRSGWIIWWPPGSQLLVYPFVASGLAIGTAVRHVTLLCIAVGAIGWGLWFALFDLPALLIALLILLLPWARYPSDSLFFYSAEVTMFASGPWMLIAAIAMYRRLERGTGSGFGDGTAALGLGLLMGLRFWLKYTSAFSSLGVLLFFGADFFKRPRRRWSWALIGLSMAIPIGLLSYLNCTLGPAANNVTQTAGWHFRWLHIVSALANPVLGLADNEAVFRWLLLHPGHPILSSETLIRVAALPFGVWYLWTLFRSPKTQPQEQLAAWTLVATIGSLLVVWTISTSADHASRHMATSVIASMPWALQIFIQRFRAETQWTQRAAAAAFCSIFIAAPLIYGVASVIAKVRRTPSDYHMDAVRVYNPLLANFYLREVVADIARDWDPKTDIWYLPEPQSALNIPGRTIVRAADFLSLKELAADHFRTSRRVRVRALMPPRFEQEGKGAVIRAAFLHAGSWTQREVPYSNYVVWEAWVEPEGSK